MSNMVWKQRKLQEVTCSLQMEVDKVLNLPGNVVDIILSHLSLRDAVRTSILSRKWRYRWVTLPNLVVDETIAIEKLVSIVDKVLLLHTGPIHKFEISHRNVQSVSDIDRWILHLSRGALKEFILEIWKGDEYKLPWSFYSCQTLTHLEVYNCHLKLPPHFDGFKRLKSLDLQEIIMDELAFEEMISSCPLLERLTLINFDGFTLLNIHAPNLRFFDVGGAFEYVIFQDTFNLAVVKIGMCGFSGTEITLRFGGNGYLVRFFASLPQIRMLEMQDSFLKYLAAGTIPEKLPTPCVDLSFLSIRINFNNIKENLAALCLLRSCPNLEELQLQGRTEGQDSGKRIVGDRGRFWLKKDSGKRIVEDSERFWLRKLRVIKIVGVCGEREELEFIKMLLRNTPNLERMSVKAGSADREWDIVKELLRFQRASVFARIIYLHP